jgi:hypothetical protein
MAKGLIWIVVLGMTPLTAEPLFSRDEQARQQAEAKENGFYQSLIRRKTKEVIVVRINTKSLAKEMLHIDLPNMSIEFATKRIGDGWEGRGKNFSRFTLREEEELFSGQIFHAGKSYRIVPIKKGISILYKVDEDQFTCGSGSVSALDKNPEGR